MSEKDGHACPPVKERKGAETEGIAPSRENIDGAKNDISSGCVLPKTSGRSAFIYFRVFSERSSSSAAVNRAFALVLRNERAS